MNNEFAGAKKDINIGSLLVELGLSDTNPGAFNGEWLGSGDDLNATSPIDGSDLAVIKQCTSAEYEQVAQRAHEAFLSWRMVPAPKRGEVIRQLGEELRRRGERVLFIGSERGLETRLVPEAGIDFVALPAQQLMGRSLAARLGAGPAIALQRIVPSPKTFVKLRMISRSSTRSTRVACVPSI